ncbi:MAG: hypothetical protein JWN02_170, partial [Acidobacteria bacterium]|nr:hypothetical protein [Acidobacteriota bacterium]
ALLTYFPLTVLVLCGPASAFRPSLGVTLPFLSDWNTAFMLLVSFPALVAFALKDQAVLAGALRRVQLDGVLQLRPAVSRRLALLWKRRFARINYFAYAMGLLSGCIVTVCNYVAYVRNGNVGYWIAVDRRLQACGYLFLLCIFALFALIPVYALRTWGISLLLRSIVKHAELRMLPFHPDHCGGLRPVGRLGLRNQYLLTVFGLNLGSLVAVSELYLKIPRSLYGLIAAAAGAYIVIGPLIFMGPLLSFRAGMIRTKAELMSEVARRLGVELHRLRQHLPSGSITREDEELIDRLRKMGAVIDELPVWPFDAGTLRKFLTAYVVPLLGAAGYPLLRSILDYISKSFLAH